MNWIIQTFYYIQDNYGIIRTLCILTIIVFTIILFFFNYPKINEFSDKIQLYIAIITAIGLIWTNFPPKPKERLSGEWFITENSQPNKAENPYMLSVKIRNNGSNIVTIGTHGDKELLEHGLGSEKNRNIKKDRNGDIIYSPYVRSCIVSYEDNVQNKGVQIFDTGIHKSDSLDIIPEEETRFDYYLRDGFKILEVKMITSSGNLIPLKKANR